PVCFSSSSVRRAMTSSISSSEPLPLEAAATRRALWGVAWLASAALATWAVGIGLFAATARFDYSEPKLRESLAFRAERFDIVFLGNSLTLEGVSPRDVDAMLGTRSY